MPGSPVHPALYRTLLILGVLFCGCSSETAPGSTVLVFKHAKIEAGAAAMRSLLDEFEAAHPGVHVRSEELPSASDEQHQFYVLNLEAGSSSFDILAVDVIWVAEFARAGWIRPLSEAAAQLKSADFFEAPIEASHYGETLFAVPWFIDAGLLYYRSDLLAEQQIAVPRRWEELVRAAAAVRRRRPDLHGFIWQGKQYEGLVCNMLEYIWSAGGEVLDKGESTLLAPENVRALRFVQDLIFRFQTTPEIVTTLTEEPSRRIFGRGGAVFLRNWPYAWRLFQQPGSPVRGKVGAAALPSFAEGESSAALGGWQLAVNTHSRNPELAEQLILHLTSPEAQKRLALGTGYQPARPALYGDYDLLRAYPFLSELKPVFERARPRPVTPHYMQISQVLQLELSAIVSGIRRPEAALERADKQVRRILGSRR